MTEKEKNTNAQHKPKIQIVKQYIKDLSFEAPNSPKIFFEKINESDKPNVKFNIDLKGNKIAETLYNIDLKVNIQHVIGEHTLYMIELVYSAIVDLNAEEKEVQKILLVDAPQLIFPTLRTIVINITQESGFPPFSINYINFEEMYEKQRTEGKGHPSSR